MFHAGRDEIDAGGLDAGMSQHMGYVQEADRAANIIHINFNLSDYEDLLEYHALNDYVEKAYVPGKNNYVLIDEIQMCTGLRETSNTPAGRQPDAV